MRNNIQVNKSHYLNEKYMSPERFINYYYQADLVRKESPRNVLFVGVGDGLVSELLKNTYDVTTFDFDPELKPDVVGDIRDLSNFGDKQFDLVCLFEVLEHVPYHNIPGILKELSRISRRVIFSVPHRRTGFEFVFKFPFIRSILHRDFVRLAIRLPIRFKGFKESGQHYWEIDGYTTPLAKFRRDVREFFTTEKEYTPLLDMYRRFFILTSREL